MSGARTQLIIKVDTFSFLLIRDYSGHCRTNGERNFPPPNSKKVVSSTDLKESCRNRCVARSLNGDQEPGQPLQIIHVQSRCGGKYSADVSGLIMIHLGTVHCYELVLSACWHARSPITGSGRIL